MAGEFRPRSIALHALERRVPGAEISLAFRQLCDLIHAGLPLVPALRMTAQQTAHPAFRKVLQDLTARVSEGRSLSRAMEAHARHFPPAYSRLVHSGETGGTLGEVLERLADLTEKEEETRSEARAALAYPLFILAAGAGTVVFLLAVIVPSLSEMFAEFEQSLPWPTRMLLGATSALERHAATLAFVAILFSAISLRRPVRRWMKQAAADLLFKVPGIRSWILKRETGSYARTLGTLLRSGVPVPQALAIAAAAVQNARFRRLVAPLEGLIRGGHSLSRCLRGIPEFPAYVVNLTAVGEQGGRLDQSLLKIADSYERQAQRELKAAVSLLEPFLILSIGAVLGLVVISIMLPIFDINALIR